jgi:co-chaperonin GroES (HSP10)
MKVSDFYPTFRNVLYEEVVKEKTDSGLYLPTKNTKLVLEGDMFGANKVQFDGAEAKLGDFVVVKTGKDCTETEPGDIILIMEGIRTTKVELEEGTYYLVTEQQVIGINRHDRISTPPGSEPETTRSSKSQA